MKRRWLFVAFLMVFGGLSVADTAHSQGRFSPEFQVGDRIVTRYQVEQRANFLSLLGAPGDTRNLARDQLVNEALQLSAAEAEGITVSQEAFEAAVAEFAARANLSAEQFLQITQERGISQATVRDFFIAGVAWRDTIRARFGESLRSTVDEGQVRRALALTGTEGGLRVLVSEILLPANTPESQRASLARAAELTRLPNEAAFAAAARQFSVAPSASNGGRVEWVAFDTLPPNVQSVIAGLTPGQIGRPITLENAIAIFLLRDAERVAAGAPEALSIDYALFIVAGGREEAARIAEDVDVCDDFYGIAKGLPEERLVRETQPQGRLPADIRAALAGLDEGETSTAITRGGNATVLMLCQRQPDTESTVDIDIVGNRILNARLGTAAVHYLAELRAETEIIDFSSN